MAVRYGRSSICSFVRKLFLDIHWTRKKTSYNFSLINYSSTSSKKVYDVVVVGGGIVGVASAREINLRHKNLKVAIAEKEPKLAYHQSGHNSGVIHAGIYYKPNSLKAKLCVEGFNLAYSYCDSQNIPYKKCGKLIVATNPLELERLNALFDRGMQNNVKDIKIVDKYGIKKIEPHCKGLKAIHSPHTGIVDWALVTQHYGNDFQKMGGEILLNFNVTGFREATTNDSRGTAYPVVLQCKNKEIQAKYVLTCGGLQSDKLSDLSYCSKDPRIVPFRGEYLILKPEKCYLVNGNIYPVPDPRFPFLGVHFTPRMDGSVWLGPNAVLAFKREGYSWAMWDRKELMETLTYAGFRKLAMKYLTYGANETLKSFFTSIQVKDLQKFVPQLTVKDVQKGPAGVRAQAMDRNGNLVDDFVFDTGTTGIGKRILHCRNAPSPGATSSLAIAKYIANKFESQFLTT
ncbi:hypothetical protein RUM44_011872 [Polyplax serrata]|uniref:L-2-hydroxyglutarate dehydrogenase, mitochondrial n=1 Tax=Polyplax serrata TaxID=468196 RepID=A0ABR1B9Q1_POLSC